MLKAYHLNNFYTKLKPFTKFSDFTNESLYTDLPESWYVVMTDIKGSTKAINEGRYRDVNTIGAASIVVATKVIGSRDFPFVFGGDGATILIGPDDIDELMLKLSSLKRLAKNNFDLDLRVARVPMRDIGQLHKEIKVSKYEISPGCSTAVIKGEGIVEAEKLIKDKSSKYEFNDDASGEIDLTGLTCRWKPTPGKRGKILTLIIQARRNEAIIYNNLLSELKSLLNQDLELLGPELHEKSKYKSMLENLKNELRNQEKLTLNLFLQLTKSIVISFLMFTLKIDLASSKAYQNSIKRHSDFIKFDGSLRMVLDCSESQIELINSLLKKQFEAGNIFFGAHVADESIMTCFVEGLGQGKHIHFIDSSNGGYAMAAIELKNQIKNSISPN